MAIDFFSATRSPVSDMIMESLAVEERSRRETIARNWNYYFGRLRPPLKVRKDGVNDNLLLNMARPIVDKGASFLFGSEVDIQVDAEMEGMRLAPTVPRAARRGLRRNPQRVPPTTMPPTTMPPTTMPPTTMPPATMPSGAPPEATGGVPAPRMPSDTEMWLDGAWEQAGDETFLSNAAVMGGVTGHVFVRILLPAPDKPYPRLVLWDTGNITVVTDPEDYQSVLKYVNQWNAIDPFTAKPIVRRQTISPGLGGQNWQITDEVSRADNPRFEVMARQSWPYPWAPVVQCQNLPAPGAFYGISDLEEDITRINDAMNFVLSNMARIIRFHAHPRVWGRGFAADKLAIGVDDILILPSQQAELHQLEMQGDLGSSLELYQRLKEALHEASRVPEIASGKLEGAGAFSGVALEILYQPLTEKTNTKRRLYGRLMCEVSCRLLEIGGHGPDHTVTLHWPAMLPVDTKERAETMALEDGLGVVSKETIADKLGYDYETEQMRIAEEQAATAERNAQMFDRGLMPDGSPIPMRAAPVAPAAGATMPPGGPASPPASNMPAPGGMT